VEGVIFLGGKKKTFENVLYAWVICASRCKRDGVLFVVTVLKEIWIGFPKYLQMARMGKAIGLILGRNKQYLRVKHAMCQF
jgi:hypothetical protein